MRTPSTKNISQNLHSLPFILRGCMSINAGCVSKRVDVFIPKEDFGHAQRVRFGI
jgi:hypothetical protein